MKKYGIPKVDDIISNFSICAEEIQKQAGDLLETIADGCVPTNDAMCAFDTKITDLQVYYDRLFDVASMKIPNDKMPPKGDSIYAVASAIADAETQLSKAKSILSKFISVKSYVEKYAEAIKPYQNEAKQLLNTFTETVSDKIIGPDLFLQAIECNDLSSEGESGLQEQICEYFHESKILLGLQQKKYFISEPDSIATICDSRSNETEGNRDSQENNILKTNPANSDDSLYNDEIRLEDKAIGKSSVFNESQNSQRVIVSAVNDKKIKTDSFNATKFKQEITELSKKSKEVRSVIPLFTKLGVLTKSQAYSFGICMGCFKDGKDALDKVRFALEQLQNKGFLASYILSDGEQVFCLSANCKSCISKDSVIQMKFNQMEFWSFSFGDYHIFGENEMPEEFFMKTLAENDKLLEYLYDVKKSLSTEKYNLIIKSLKHITGGYIIGVFDPEFILCTTAEPNAEIEDLPRLFINCTPDGDVRKGYIYKNGILSNLSSNQKEETEGMFEESLLEKSNILNENSIEETDFINEKSDSSVLNDSEHKSKPLNPTTDLTGKEEKNSNNTSAISSDVIRNEIYNFIVNDKVYCATAYAKSMAENNKEVSQLYFSLAYAVNDPLIQCEYTSNNVFDMLENSMTEFDKALIIATSLRTFFSNQVRYDHNLQPLYSSIQEFELLKACTELRNSIYDICNFKIEQKKGIDAYADYRLKNQEKLDQAFSKLNKDAEDFYNNYILGKKKETKSIERFLKMKQMIFEPNGEIGQYIKAIIDKDIAYKDLAVEFLTNNFYKDDFISENTIDESLLWNYIEHFWNKAKDEVLVRRREDLYGSLRTNIINLTIKAVKLIARWCDLVERRTSNTQDYGALAYKKLKNNLVKELQGALEELDSYTYEKCPIEKHAGICIVKKTVKELLDSVTGVFDENDHRYFYSPFLLTDDVILDEQYIPDMEMHSSDIPEISIQRRIQKFSSVESLPTFSKRLCQILDGNDEYSKDNYGTLERIIEYCSVMEPSVDLTSASKALGGKKNASVEATDRKNEFIGELEFAQANGQINGSDEDEKEKILQIVDNWFYWSEETGNYGFFKYVLKAYLDEIKVSSKDRAQMLLKELEEQETDVIDGLTQEEKETKEKIISRVKTMICAQKYTAAEDMLRILSNPDKLNDFSKDEEDAFFEKDYLYEFLSHYDDYYKPVVTHQESFSGLAKKYLRNSVVNVKNKETKGAMKLIDNWLPGGSDLGKERLKNLLNLLGFKVKSIEEQYRIGKFENYIIRTETIHSGKKVKYPHPIAAFGSNASKDGFRVVCMTGTYDDKKLISVMQQIGNAKHTLILLDHALGIDERKSLARKSKKELGDKFFGVLDRTIMLFLIRNFDETQNSRILISLIAPFGYYQPYEYDPSKPMAPEIFIGRKKELEQIESSTGCNIVYGGRQLGKSALLKKAEQDIDKNENGDRAVYIDIKSMRYGEVAKTIAHELYDCGILNEDIDTSDWDELTRCLKRRLNDESNPLPYLLLLLDEADAFIKSSEEVNYRPFDFLKDIQGTGKFKFIVAGLHNVVRFNREAALGNNSVLPHLSSITVKPFNYTEARELMEVPLHYLGFRFPSSTESQDLIPTILAATNYFPGLIQLYCAKLLEALRENNYAGYEEKYTPPYEVSEEHIKKVLADKNFTEEIKNKFYMTLTVEEDKYYMVIAIIMAFLYHEKGYNRGYTVEDIKNVSNEFGIKKISELTLENLTAFMEELRDLNIFRNTDSSHFLFTRYNFFQMMGSKEEVENKLEDYMEE